MDIPDELLAPAVAAARRALDELDASEVPAKLRRVAVSSARRLPAPLLRSLLQELDGSEWLRSRTLEHLEAGDDPPSRASQLFLERPAGWEGQMAGLCEEILARQERRSEERYRAEITRLQEELAETTEALRRAREEMRTRVAEVEEAARRATEDRLRRSRRRVDELAGEVSRLRAELARSEEERARLEEELMASDRQMVGLRERLRRRHRRGDDEPAGYGWSRTDPFELARDLDRLVASLEVGVVGRGVHAESPKVSALPGGVRPDEAAAIEWVRRWAGPLVLLVDGHNVAFEMADGSPDEGIRRKLEAYLRRLWRTAEGPLRVVLFYDSSHAPDVVTTPGVEIRYVPDADDALVEAVEGAAVPTVVVSSDREVRERTEAAGAITLWATALTEWIGA